MEEGRWVKWIRLGALLAVMLAMFGAYIFDPWYWGLYKGLNHPKAIEQAQIARELARGHGFSTKMIRPLAYSQFKTNTGDFPADRIPDTYQAPLWPMTLAPALLAIRKCPDAIWPFCEWPYRTAVKDRWEMSTREYVYVNDRVVSAVAMIFFFLSILIYYFLVRRLFDHHLAIWTVLLMLGCNLFWEYSMSGLPQMMMAFLFSGALYFLVRAIEDKNAGRWPFGWLAVSALLLGLMTLAHGMGIWVFLGALIFCILYFKPRLRTTAVMVGIFVLVYSPWLIRNYHVCGNPLGISGYALLDQIKGSENVLMRSLELDTSGISPIAFRRKLQAHVCNQMGQLFSEFGSLMVAPLFFLALLHLFKNQVPRTFRWALLLMWSFALIGTGIIGSNDEGAGVSANDLNILFIPLFTTYGMALVLVLWSRLEITVRLVKRLFFAAVFLVCSIPLLNNFSVINRSPVQWPPYVPPYIAIMRDWTMPGEIIASDMPWAVAWYADRKSVWLPMTIQNFLDLNDYERLGAKIAGIYLTPLTGNQRLISDIVKGDYKEWAPFILRNVNIKEFPLRAVTAMPLDNQCIFYSDRDRWTDRMD